MLVSKIFADKPRWLPRLVLAAGLVVVQACSTNTITLSGDFPAPLVDALPLSLGVYYPEDFANHKYEWEPRGAQQVRLIMDTGQIQTTMFNTLLPPMFEKVVMLDSYPPADSVAVDLVLVPTVDEFQHAVPSHTKINVFEIWIRYRMQLFDAAGEPVADWIMSSYGKTPTAFMQSNNEGINAAANVALRDAGANFALNFARVPEVELWLEEHLEAEHAGESP